MRIAIMGAGGVGCYLGARFAAAGIDTTLIARGPHLDAMRTRGLMLQSPRGDVSVPDIKATDDPATIGPVDTVILTVKLHGIEAACRAIAPLLGPETAVVPIQNGVAMPEWLPVLVGADHAVGGTVFISASIPEPGRVRHLGSVHRLVVGELGAGGRGRLARFAEAGTAAGIDVEVSTDIRRVLWEKFLFLASSSGIGCLSRQPIGAIQIDPDIKATFVEAMTEVEALARAKGIALAPDVVARTLAFAETFDPSAKMSMLEDLEAGKPLEVDWLSGAVVAMGAEVGIPTPVHRTAYACLKHSAMGR